MKKIMAVLLVIALLVPVMAVAESMGRLGLGTMYVYTANGKSLNVRSTPQTGDNIIGHVKYGGSVNVVGFYGDWAEISWGDTTAYVQKRFLQWYAPKDKPQPQPTKDPDADEKAKMQRELDSETAIKVYFKPSSDYTGTPTVTVDGNDYTATKTGGRWVVVIPNISAHELIDSHTIVLTTAKGTATVTVSALSYVKGALDYYTEDADSQNAMAAIYAYSKAAQDFKAAH